MSEALKTALFDLHVECGAKMVEFAGYMMPLQYEGIMNEHLHTRAKAGLFDVSHMGQVLITATAEDIEKVLSIDALGMASGQQAYNFLLNNQGGTEDDLMVTRRDEDFYVVLNASRKAHDMEILRAHLGEDKVNFWTERALLALQGPEAVAVLSAWVPEVQDLAFMRGAMFDFDGVDCWVSRSGYSGEDGFEVSVPNAFAERFVRRLLSDERVKLCGLGARDSLRLEAGLCLYGNELSSEISPLEAGLFWAVAKVRRPDGARAGGFIGADALRDLREAGVKRKRVGLKVLGKLPVRAHVALYDGDVVVGEVSSGGFAPSLQAPVAMAYVESSRAVIGQMLEVEVRGKRISLEVVALPFVSKSYKK